MNKREFDNMKTAMISGVTGQDGSYLAEHLLSLGYRVIGLKRRTSLLCTDRIDHIFQNPNFYLEYYDLNDSGCIYRLFQEYRPDEFYHLAAQSHVKVSFDVPENTIEGITLGTLRILEAIRIIHPSCKFYQASSSEMFGDNPEFPFNEESKMMPASPYANAKLFAHNLVRNYRKAYNLFCCSGVMFNHESPRRGETFVTQKIVKSVNRIRLGFNEKIHLGNLDAVRDWGYAKEYVEAMHLMLQQDKPDDFVIATGIPCSVRDFLRKCFEYANISNYKSHIVQDSKYFRKHEVPYLLGNSKKAEKILGWKPKTDVDGLIKIMMDAQYDNR